MNVYMYIQLNATISFTSDIIENIMFAPFPANLQQVLEISFVIVHAFTRFTRSTRLNKF